MCSRQYLTVREDVHEVVNDLFSREVESGLYLIRKVSQNLVTLNVTLTSVRCKNRLKTEIFFNRVYCQDSPTENLLFTKK